MSISKSVTDSAENRTFDDGTQPDPITIPVGLSDVPAKLSADALEYRVYAEAIVDFLMHENTHAPFSLAITGAWGSGKTTLLRWIKEDLKGRGRRTVWFSPWKHSNHDQVWASFSRAISEQLLLSFTDKLRLRWERLKAALPPVKIWKIAGISAVLIGLLMLVGVIFLGFDPLVGLAALTPVVLPPLGSLFKAMKSPLLKMLASAAKGPDYEARLGFQKEFEEDLARLIGLATTPDKPLFIFVDDLDRAPPPVPAQLLEAMNILIGMERCIFVVGLDVTIVGASIEAKYLPIIERLGSRSTAFAGRHFIEKLVQLEFALPALTDRQVTDYLHSLIQRRDPGREHLPAGPASPVT